LLLCYIVLYVYYPSIQVNTNINLKAAEMHVILGCLHIITSLACYTEQRIRCIYIGCRCSLHTQLLMRRGGGGMEQLQHGHQAQLYSYLSSNCFPLISLICHLKKKASRAATQTLLRSFFPGTRCSVYINH